MFDPAWEAAHEAQEWGRWPSENLVRFVKRRFPSHHGPAKVVVDLGCGAGAQTAFLGLEGFDVCAVDGSAAAIERAKEQLELRCGAPSMRGDMYAYGHGNLVWWDRADIADWRPPFAVDAVVDVATLQHLDDSDAVAVVERARGWLKPGGWFFSLHASNEADDTVVSRNGTVRVRRAGRSEIRGLFHGYGVALGHEIIDRPQGGRVAHWIIEAQKPE